MRDFNELTQPGQGSVPSPPCPCMVDEFDDQHHALIFIKSLPLYSGTGLRWIGHVLHIK